VGSADSRIDGNGWIAPRCPFLGQTMVNDTFVCLSDEEAIAISRRYGDSYCLSEQHVKCSLYIAATLAGTPVLPTPPPRPEYGIVEIIGERVDRSPQLTPGRTSSAELGTGGAADHVAAGGAASLELAPLTSREGRAQAIEIAAQLNKLVMVLAGRVRDRRADNAELERRLRTLEEMADNEAFLRRMLDTSETPVQNAQEIAAVQQVLQAILTNPSNLETLVALAQQRDRLDQLVNAYIRIQRVLDPE